MSARLSVWRIDKRVHLATAKSGEGARRVGGRWNAPGLPAIYCGESLPLCYLEILVHATTPAERADPRIWFEITLPADQVRRVVPKKLPDGWDDPMRLHPATVQLGSDWLRSATTIALRVPSAVVPDSWNFILNPMHPLFRRAARWSAPQPLVIDRRLVGQTK